MLAPEYPARTLAREVFGHVNILASTVVTLARIAFGILVREHKRHCFKDYLGDKVLGRDHLKVVGEPSLLVCYRRGYLRVYLGKRSIH